MVNDYFRGLFIGKSCVAIGSFRQDDKTLCAKTPSKWMPFAKHKPILSNIHKHIDNYEERILVNFAEGRTDQKIRVYPFDIDTFEPYYPMMNSELKRTVESLSAERDYLFQRLMEMEEILRVAGMDNLVKEKFKQDYDYFTQLRPGFTFNKPDGGKKK